VKWLRDDAERGPLGRRGEAKVGNVTTADDSDWTIRVNGGWWYASADCEVEEEAAIGAAAAVPAAPAAEMDARWRRLAEADFGDLVNKRVRLVQDPAVPLSRADAERGPLGKRDEAKTGIVTREDVSDFSSRVNDAWWYWRADIEVEVAGPGGPVAPAPAPAAGGTWRRVTLDVFPTLVGKRVRWVADPLFALTGINVEEGILLDRAAGKVATVQAVDASDSTVKAILVSTLPAMRLLLAVQPCLHAFDRP